MNYYSTTQKIFLVLVLSIAGCLAQQKPNPTFYDNPGLHISHDTAVSMNWLAIAGSVTIALGVAAFMNGQKAATSILAAGVTLFAIGIIAASALSLFEQYKTVILVILCALGIVGFFVFAGTALDITGDGKFGWSDIKAVFLKIRRKPKNEQK